MACAHPIKIHQKGITHNVPCGQCMPCRVQYQEQIMFAASLELMTAYKNGFGASFCTFTYSDDKLPENGSLRKKDLQLFIKRLRSNIDYRRPQKKFKYIACGEYGDTFGRAHYHSVFIGLSDYEANIASKECWKNGLIDIQPLGRGGMRYVTKYCTKQIKGDKAVELYDNQGIERPFLLRSKNMGKAWMMENIEKLTEDNFHYNKNSKMVPIPKYYRNKLDIYKNYDKTYVIEAMKKTASALDMDFAEYTGYIRRINEKTLIDAARASGQPVDHKDYLIDRSYHSDLSSKILDIVDPIPF
ncbi:MAG: hypothetical protein QXQ24_08415 [Nitrososphaeria archaeon]